VPVVAILSGLSYLLLRTRPEPGADADRPRTGHGGGEQP
jgi:hypothetical protein